MEFEETNKVHEKYTKTIKYRFLPASYLILSFLSFTTCAGFVFVFINNHKLFLGGGREEKKKI